MYVGEIKKEARERFALNRYQAMLVYGVVYTLALNIAVLTTVLFLVNKWAVWYGVILIFLFLLMLAPFGFGMTGFYLKLYRFEKADAFHIFEGFNKYNLERVIILRLLKFALWLAFTLLLIVPGIIFSIRTSMATYILRANPKMKPQEALRASNRIMKGHCGKYFGLSMSFIGWYFMGLITCGLGYIWVMPYFNSAKIVFYKREIQGDKAVYRNPVENGVPAEDHDYTEEDDDEDEERKRILAEIAGMNAKLDAGKAPSHTAVQTGQTAKPVNPKVQPHTQEKATGAEQAVSGDTEPQTELEIYDTADTQFEPEIIEIEELRAETEPEIHEQVAQEVDANTVVATVEPQSEVAERRHVRETVAARPSRDRMIVHESRPLPGGRVISEPSGRRVVPSRPVSGAALPEREIHQRAPEAAEMPLQRTAGLRDERSSRRERVSASQVTDRRTPRRTGVEIKEDE